MFGFHALPKLVIEKSCSADWSGMQAAEGGQHFCGTCQKHVYDLPSMTAREIRRILRSSPDGICGRILYDRRGEVVVRPEPLMQRSRSLVQLSALGAASLSAGSLAAAENGRQSTVAHAAAAGTECAVKVSVKDPSGAPIVGATVELTRADQPGQAQVGDADAAGLFERAVSPGTYSLRVQSVGFASFDKSSLDLACHESAPVTIPVELQVGGVGGVAVCVRPNPVKRSMAKLSNLFRRLV